MTEPSSSFEHLGGPVNYMLILHMCTVQSREKILQESNLADIASSYST